MQSGGTNYNHFTDDIKTNFTSLTEAYEKMKTEFTTPGKNETNKRMWQSIELNFKNYELSGSRKA